VTELADFAACPRRYELRHEIGLHEFPAIVEERSADTLVTELHTDDEPPPLPGLDAAERGTLAHRLLERVDFAAAPAQREADLGARLLVLGHDPSTPDVADVRRRVAAFLDTPFARGLGARLPGAVRREVPFAFAVGPAAGPRLLIKGQMDLVVADEDGLTILDYKLIRDAAPDAHRFQLLTYAAAARALWRPARLRVGLVLLGAADPGPRIEAVDDAELDDALARLGDLATALASARQHGSFDGRPIDRCRALRCGYVARCYSGSMLMRRTSEPPG
jgi:ATP-dependent helicase/nuclease subunit A